MTAPVVLTKKMAAAAANNIAASQSPGTAALTLNGSTVSGGVATIDAKTASNSAIGRRVLLTSGGDDSSITFAIVGTNSTGSRITDTVTGSNGSTAQSNLDFVTVTSITPSAAIAGTIIAGTNQVGSSPWIMMNNALTPMNLGIEVELVSGSATYQVEYTYDDPNNLGADVTYPTVSTVLTPATLKGPASATSDGAITSPIFAARLTTITGTGELRARFLQAGIG